MRYHLTSVRMAVIKEIRDNKSWCGCGEKGTLLVELQIGTATMENSVFKELLKNVKIEILYDPATPLLGIYPKGMKTLT